MKNNEKEEVSFFDKFKVILFSIIGVIIFFVPIKLNNNFFTIYFHLINYLKDNYIDFLKLSIILFITLGSFKSIYKSNGDINIYTYIRICSIFLVFNIFFTNKNLFLIDETTFFILEEIIINIFVSIFVGSIFINLLIDYSVVETVEFLFSKFTKKLFNISGRGFLCIVILFFTDYFFGLFFMNKLFKEGKLKHKESAIIILNFFIAPFYILNYVSDKLNLRIIDVILFNLTILFFVNLITTRIYPINKKKNSYLIKNKVRSKKYKNIEEVLEYTSKKSNDLNIFKNILSNVEDGIDLTIKFFPDIVILMYIISSILNNINFVSLFEVFLNPILEFLKYNDESELSKFIVYNFYSGIYSLENINLNIDYVSRTLISLIFCIGSVNIIGNILFSKITKIEISNLDFLVTYILRIILITIFYSIIVFIKRGFLL